MRGDDLGVAVLGVVGLCRLAQKAGGVLVGNANPSLLHPIEQAAVGGQVGAGAVGVLQPLGLA